MSAPNCPTVVYEHPSILGREQTWDFVAGRMAKQRPAGRIERPIGLGRAIITRPLARFSSVGELWSCSMLECRKFLFINILEGSDGGAGGNATLGRQQAADPPQPLPGEPEPTVPVAGAEPVNGVLRPAGPGCGGAGTDAPHRRAADAGSPLRQPPDEPAPAVGRVRGGPRPTAPFGAQHGAGGDLLQAAPQPAPSGPKSQAVPAAARFDQAATLVAPPGAVSHSSETRPTVRLAVTHRGFEVPVAGACGVLTEQERSVPAALVVHFTVTR